MLVWFEGFEDRIDVWAIAILGSGFVFIDLRRVNLSRIKDGGLAFSVRMLNVKSMFFYSFSNFYESSGGSNT